MKFFIKGYVKKSVPPGPLNPNQKMAPPTPAKTALQHAKVAVALARTLAKVVEPQSICRLIHPATNSAAALVFLD